MNYTVITGASSGIGRATALAFASRQKHLILIARREERLVSLKEEILTHHPQLDIVIKVCDLTNHDVCLTLYRELSNYSLETWINNAGFGKYAEVATQSLDSITSMLQLNVEALTMLSTLFVHDYHDVPGTQLINVSSSGGYTIVPTAVTYCATKFYVSAFTEGLALQLAKTNAPLQAKVLAPSATETEFANVANETTDYDYQSGFARYHTSEEMASFLLDLYDSQAVVGQINRDTFEFELSGPLFNYVGKHNNSN